MNNSPVFVLSSSMKLITVPNIPKKHANEISIYSSGILFAANIAVTKASIIIYISLISDAIFFAKNLLNDNIRYPIIKAGSNIKISIMYFSKTNTLS